MNGCCPYFSDRVANGSIRSSASEVLIVLESRGQEARLMSIFFCPWCGEKKLQPHFFGTDRVYPSVR